MTDEDHANEPKCTSDRESWTCKNMKEIKQDWPNMETEEYECAVCGRTMTLYYDEMR